MSSAPSLFPAILQLLLTLNDFLRSTFLKKGKSDQKPGQANHQGSGNECPAIHPVEPRSCVLFASYLDCDSLPM